MYEKTNWKARKGTGLNKFTETERAGNTVVLTNTPDSVTEPGTPFSEDNMNHIEHGIFEAHEANQALQGAITKEINDRTTALDNHDDSNTAHAKIRAIISNLIGLPEYNSTSHVIRFTAQNGATMEIDLPLEELVQNIDYEPDTKKIVLTKKDGTKIRIDISDLLCCFFVILMIGSM